jgi:hypothetical protein
LAFARKKIASLKREERRYVFRVKTIAAWNMQRAMHLKKSAHAASPFDSEEHTHSRTHVDCRQAFAINQRDTLPRCKDEDQNERTRQALLDAVLAPVISNCIYSVRISSGGRNLTYNPGSILRLRPPETIKGIPQHPERFLSWNQCLLLALPKMLAPQSNLEN